MRACLAFLFAVLLPVLAWAQSAGHVARLQGEARVERAGAPLALATGSGLEVGDRLNTGTDARLEIRLEDGTSLTLGENAALVLEAFLFQPERQRGDARVRVDRGAFLVISGGLATLPDKPLSIITPLAVIGIRGTMFWGGRLEHPLEVMVADGAIWLRSPAGSVEVAAGQGTSITAAEAAPTPPTRWSDEKRRTAYEMVEFR